MRAPQFTRCQADGCCNLIGPAERARPRKWCSDRCRKSQYCAPCEGCGARLSGSDGRGPNAPRRCVACVGEHLSEVGERAETALEMWRLRETEGLLNREIAPVVGRTVMTVTTELKRLRVLGFAVPKAPYRGAEARPTRAMVADKGCAALKRDMARMGVYPPDAGLPWREGIVA